jgi:hypothetical protein
MSKRGHGDGHGRHGAGRPRGMRCGHIKSPLVVSDGIEECNAISNEGEKCERPKNHEGMHEATDGIVSNWRVRWTS